MKKKIKVNWDNVFDLFIFIICIVIIIHDIVMLIRGWSFTWFGLITLFIACLGADVTGESLYTKIKSIPKESNKDTHKPRK